MAIFVIILSIQCDDGYRISTSPRRIVTDTYMPPVSIVSFASSRFPESPFVCAAGVPVSPICRSSSAKHHAV